VRIDHPMPVLLAFFLGATAASIFAPPEAALVASCYLAFAFARHGLMTVLQRALQQWWRMKWLLLATLVFMAWPVPGVPLAERLPEYLPSREGLLLALAQTLRVMVVILLYAALPGSLNLPERLAGLQGWLRHFGATGKRFSLRLALTLQQLETMRGRDHWRILRESQPPAPVVLPVLPALVAMGPGDRRLCFLLALIFGLGLALGRAF
jgi:hypothetical protein